MGSQEGRDAKGKFIKGNQLQSNGGRPPKFKTPEELEELANEFFAKCRNEQLPYTLTGLTLHLGFCDKNILYYYRDNKPEFYHSIKKALLEVEMGYETNLNSKAATGAIFALKNFGWKDKREVEQNTKHSFEGISDEELEKKKKNLERVINEGES